MFRGCKRLTSRVVVAGSTLVLVLAATDAGASTPTRLSSAALPSPVSCTQPAGNPDPKTDPVGWEERDADNVICGSQRTQDQLDNPAFLHAWAMQYAAATGAQPASVLAAVTADPTHPRLGLTSLQPQDAVTDPFRAAALWQGEGRGREQQLTIDSSTGAHLNARLYSPNPSSPATLHAPLVFIPGLQSYVENALWFGEELAEAGYIVLVIDPQGQGDSENLPHNPDGSIACSSAGCPNLPTTDMPEVESAIEFMLSTPAHPDPYAVGANAEGTQPFNPLWADIDPSRLGIAGHSLGAIATVPLGQQDPRVKAQVSFDDLDATYAPSVVPSLHAPTLFFSADYVFPQPPLPKNVMSPPDPNQHLGAYNQLVRAGVDTMEIDPRASTHYEWSYEPFPASLPASRYGELISGYYTLAWFDRYLRQDPTALRRLTASTFDDSIDVHSIGSGTYDAALAAADPTNLDAGNVPYRISGLCVANLVSFYFRSAYWLNGGAVQAGDLRARGCTSAASSTGHSGSSTRSTRDPQAGSGSQRTGLKRAGSKVAAGAASGATHSGTTQTGQSGTAQPQGTLAYTGGSGRQGLVALGLLAVAGCAIRFRRASSDLCPVTSPE